MENGEKSAFTCTEGQDFYSDRDARLPIGRPKCIFARDAGNPGEEGGKDERDNGNRQTP